MRFVDRSSPVLPWLIVVFTPVALVFHIVVDATISYGAVLSFRSGFEIPYEGTVASSR
jgi:hypothetical protein